MDCLPLFHLVGGQPVIVLGEGEMARPRHRLLERAGARVVSDLQQGIDEGARIAFIAHDDARLCAADALRLRGAGLLVNVVDRPELCDFYTPSLLDRAPVLIAIGTGGASAGLAKHVRLGLERRLPGSLGLLARRLFAARGALRARFPEAAARRRALDAALGPGGALDPFAEGSAGRVDSWLAAPDLPPPGGLHELIINSDDPDDLTLRQARLLGEADVVIADRSIAAPILLRARADAQRLFHPHSGPLPPGMVISLRRAR